jgi:hypothetical protein
MDMKSFVPRAVEEYFNEFLYGIPGLEGGAYEKIEILESLVNSLPRNFDSPSSSATKPPQETRIPGLITGSDADELRAFREAIEVHKRKVRNIEILSTHPDMEEAYRRLDGVLTTRQLWRNFMFSAIEADAAYLRHRAIEARGKELAPKIATSASDLADLLSEFNLLDFDNFPLELSSIWHLLRVSIDEFWADIEPEELVRYKQLLLGEIDPLPEPAQPQIQNVSQLSALRELLLEDDRRAERVAQHNNRTSPADNNRLSAPSAWASTPSVTTLLRKLSASANDFQPKQGGMIAAPLDNREKHPRNQYVRGFAFLLLERDIPLMHKVRNAMATIATVLYDDPNKTMSPRDVKDALKKYFPV